MVVPSSPARNLANRNPLLLELLQRLAAGLAGLIPRIRIERAFCPARTVIPENPISPLETIGGDGSTTERGYSTHISPSSAAAIVGTCLGGQTPTAPLEVITYATGF
jgi:hypothetical protein